MKKRIYGYKGFNSELKCRGTQFEIGKEYSKPISKLPLKTCTADGFHYCTEFEKVFNYYSYHSKPINRFCKIEVLGEHTAESDKSVTNHFKIVKEYSRATTDRYLKIKESKQLKQMLLKGMGIPVVKQLQTKYPNLIIGGSTALFIHGIKLQRFGLGAGDIDATLPYFELLESDKDLSIEETEDYTSGADYDKTFSVNGKKMDLRIDPKTAYEYVEFDNFRFKVIKLEVIMEAKWRYALKGNAKHKADCYEMLGKLPNNGDKNKLPF